MATTGLPEEFIFSTASAYAPLSGEESPTPSRASTTISDQERMSSSDRAEAFGMISTSIFCSMERLTFASPVTAAAGASSATRTGTPRIREPPRKSQSVAAVVPLAADDGDPRACQSVKEPLHLGHDCRGCVLHQHRAGNAELPDRPAVDPFHLFCGHDLHGDFRLPYQHHLGNGIPFIMRIAQQDLLHALEVHQVLDPARNVHDRARRPRRGALPCRSTSRPRSSPSRWP